ncbi:MAG: hypothetical protein AABX47_07530 [Nanoarchaeota archaeon]
MELNQYLAQLPCSIESDKGVCDLRSIDDFLKGVPIQLPPPVDGAKYHLIKDGEVLTVYGESEGGISSYQISGNEGGVTIGHLLTDESGVHFCFPGEKNIKRITLSKTPYYRRCKVYCDLTDRISKLEAQLDLEKSAAKEAIQQARSDAETQAYSDRQYELRKRAAGGDRSALAILDSEK